MSTNANSGTSTLPAATPAKHIVKGIFMIVLGLIAGYLWLWGNALQIQTSEAWITGARNANLSPQLSIILQLTQLWSGHLNLREIIAYAWGWLNQILLLFCSVGVEYALVSKKRAVFFKWACACFVLLNSLADLSFGSAFGGQWQPWAFAAICCFATFSLGVAAVGLIVEGVRQIL